MAYFGDLGGLFEITFAFGSLISAVLVTRLFQSAMVESTYRTQGYSEDHTSSYSQAVISNEEKAAEPDVEHANDQTDLSAKPLAPSPLSKSTSVRVPKSRQHSSMEPLKES